jgi:hypothetical protein
MFELDFWQKVGVWAFVVLIPVGVIVETIANREMYLIKKRMNRKFRKN